MQKKLFNMVAMHVQVGSYFNTFNHASKESKEGFQHLVAEQTPGMAGFVGLCLVAVGTVHVY